MGFEVRSSVKAMPQHRPNWIELLSLKILYFRSVIGYTSHTLPSATHSNV